MLGANKGKRLQKYVPDYVVFDLETTGISNIYDQVIEISAVKVKDGQVVDEFSSLVNPGRKIPAGASAVNGITDEMVCNAPVFFDVLNDFIEFIGDGILVGHNINSFDMGFIWRDTEKYFGELLTNDYIDTYLMAKTCLPQLAHKRLTDLAEYYNISPEGAHRALNDCRMNQQVFECLAKEMDPVNAEKNGLRICPLCGGTMQKRNGRFGEFWGCSGYPGCRHTERC